MTAGQLLLVVYQLRKLEPGFHDFEATVSILGRSWWEDPALYTNTHSKKEERMMKKAFHDWVRDQPEVVRDVAAACGEVKRVPNGGQQTLVDDMNGMQGRMNDELHEGRWSSFILALLDLPPETSAPSSSRVAPPSTSKGVIFCTQRYSIWHSMTIASYLSHGEVEWK